MADIEQKIEIARISILMSEANDQHFQRRSVGGAAELFDDQTTKRVDGVIRGIDYKIRRLTDLIHGLSFRANGMKKPLAGLGGMRPPSLRKASLEGFVGCLEKNDK